MKKYNFDIQDLLTIGLVLVVTGIALAFGLGVMENVQDQFYDDTVNATQSVAYNATGDALEGVATLPANLPTIALVVVAAIIIGILVRYLFVRIR